MFLLGLYINSNGQAVEATLLGTWSDSTLVPSNAHFNTYNEVWGLEVNNHEFAVVGSTYGTHIIDVTEPSSPEELFVVAGGTTGGVIVHRDFHDYKGYLYSIADEGANTSLQIIDTRNLPTSIDVVYDNSDYFTRSHNIFIDTAKARLYSLISNGTTIGFSPMRIFDISDPIDPQPIGSYSALDGYQISQVHDAFVKNDTAYLNLGPSGFAIVDFINIDIPNVISVLSPSEYPQSGYNHSGWPTKNGDFYYMADENLGKGIKVMDMRNLPEIEFPSIIDAGDSISIAHNQIVHNGKLFVSYYFHGLQVYDISDPSSPIRILNYPTSIENIAPNLYRGAWGVYPFLSSGNILVTDMQNGLFVLDGDIPTSTEFVNNDNHLMINPNPNNGVFNIKLRSEHLPSQIEIYNSSNQVVFKGVAERTETQIDLNGITNGIYVIKIKSGKKVMIKQIVINNSH